jgi:hypothetical protein
MAKPSDAPRVELSQALSGGCRRVEWPVEVFLVETFRTRWHRWRIRRWDRAEVRSRLAVERALRWQLHHTTVLLGSMPSEPAPPADVTVDLVDPADYRLRLAEFIEGNPDEPDSPEADHLFWESSAEEHLEGG